MNPVPSSHKAVRVELSPLGKVLTVEPGTPLQDLLYAQGVEFPCGGHGRCKGCRVKVLAGELPVTTDEARVLSRKERAEGWRLACRGIVQSDLTLELEQWEATILADETVFTFTPKPGLGVAIDLGTTTIVAQLLDLQTGHVLAVRMGLNEQARYGADIMSRIDFAVAGGGQIKLTGLIRQQIGTLIEELLAAAPGHEGPVAEVVIVGNTVMHHLFCGLEVEPLSRHPFAPTQDELQLFTPSQLGWNFLCPAPEDPFRSASAKSDPDEPTVRFMPCLGGFVGSDILAGVLATKLHESDALTVLIDLGTNGEIVVGNRQRMVCASTAAGPAFEGARISMGMRAATGAISEVRIKEGQWHCHVLGQVPARGLCGSGLVDAVACGLDLGWIEPNGRLAKGSSLVLAPPVTLTQGDIRELQLAKAAIAAGVRILVQQWGARMAEVARVYLAGAFGNYINRTSAQRIGMIAFPTEKVMPAGNTALLGAKLALFNLPVRHSACADLRAKIQHVSLNEDPQFQDIFVEELGFPEAASTPNLTG